MPHYNYIFPSPHSMGPTKIFGSKDMVASFDGLDNWYEKES